MVQGQIFFSLAILLWEILTLRIPFGSKLNIEMHARKVYIKKMRPKIPSHWSNQVRTLVREGWSHCAADRPLASCICAIMKNESSQQKKEGEIGSNRKVWIHKMFSNK